LRRGVIRSIPSASSLSRLLAPTPDAPLHLALAGQSRLARLEAMIERMARPRKRRIIRDEHGRVSGAEDVI